MDYEFDFFKIDASNKTRYRYYPAYKNESQAMLSNYFYTYAFRARIAPCLIATLPLGAAILPYYDKAYGWGFFSLFFIQVSIAVLISQFSRDAGKRIQSQIFNDSMPHVCFLRFRDTKYTLEKKHKLHNILSQFTSTVNIDENTEASDKNYADSVYNLWCDYLKQYTRGKKSFHLVQEENTNYAFRRNLFGLKGVWKASIVFSSLMLLLSIYLNPTVRADNITTFVLIVCSVISCSFVTKHWVIMAADEYANQLHLAAFAIPCAKKHENFSDVILE